MHPTLDTLTPRQLEMEDLVKEFMKSLGEYPEQVAAKLDEMGIKGKMGVSDSCPLANAIKREFDVCADVDYVGTGIEVDGKFITFCTPIGCDQFIQDFDKGEYPHLDELNFTKEADEPIVVERTIRNAGIQRCQF